MKALLVISDGLSGRPTDYNGKSCLEAADTPNLDELAQRGINGLLDPIGPGISPGSDTAHLSIFGYNPQEYYTGRGVFEALGIGMDAREGDICFRTNFATVDEDFVIQDRRAGRIKEGQKELEEALQALESPQSGVEILFKTSVEHRGALILRGQDLSHEITDPDIHKTGIKVRKAKPKTEKKSAKKTAKILNELARQSYPILRDLPLNKKREKEGKLPANLLLPRGASIKTNIPSLKDIYGIDGVAIAAGALYIGIARAIGLEFKKAKGVTGRADSPIIKKAKLAAKELENEADFAFVHMKGADSCAHDHDAEGKIAFIEKVDETIELLLNKLNWDETHLAFTGDHTTPIIYGDHVSDPVPIVFAGPNVAPDDVKEFSERGVPKGGVGRISGRVVPILFGYCDWLEKFGA